MPDTLLIQSGDIVTLKSGGPAMTVEGMQSTPLSVAQRIGEQTGQMARVAWADATGFIHEGAFWLHMLMKKADDPAPEKPIAPRELTEPEKRMAAENADPRDISPKTPTKGLSDQDRDKSK